MTGFRLLMAALTMAITATSAAILPAWVLWAALPVAAVTGLLSPEIERAWARSSLPWSDGWWRDR
jgi:hypothetical protein